MRNLRFVKLAIEPGLRGRRQDLDESVFDPPIRHIEFVGIDDAEQLVTADPDEDGALWALAQILLGSSDDPCFDREDAKSPLRTRWTFRGRDSFTDSLGNRARLGHLPKPVSD